MLPFQNQFPNEGRMPDGMKRLSQEIWEVADHAENHLEDNVKFL